MENNINKKSILTELRAIRKDLKALASGKAVDEIRVDTRIEAAASIMDKARAALENDRMEELKKTGDVGHQLRIMNLLKYLEDDAAVLTFDELAEAVAPVAFDPITKRMISNAVCKGHRDYKQAMAELDEIYSSYDMRRNAISVLKAQAEELRGMRDRVETATLIKNGAVDKLFEAFEQAVENWNDELTVFG